MVNLHLESVMLDHFDARQFCYLFHLEVMHLGSVSIPSDVVLMVFSLVGASWLSKVGG